MSEAQAISLAPLTFTDAAATKVAALISEEENPNLFLRVSIKGGGCSGFEYVFSFDENIAADDTVIKKTVAKLVVDPISLAYLKDATIDYKEDLEGARFTIKNPNAKTTCGCGSSFDV